MEYTALGHTTHLAARMEQLATPGSIRITAETLRLAEGFIEARGPLGPVPVKGLAEPAEIYEVTGAWSMSARARGIVPPISSSPYPRVTVSQRPPIFLSILSRPAAFYHARGLRLRKRPRPGGPSPRPASVRRSAGPLEILRRSNRRERISPAAR